MLKQTLCVAVVVALAGVAATCQAQQLNLNMNGMMQRQAELYDYGQRQAAQAAQDWYESCLELRRSGYTGPIPSPVTTQDLMRANAELQQAQRRHLAAAQRHSAHMADAAEDYSRRGIQGQGIYFNPLTGQRVIVPASYPYYQQTPYGQFAPGFDPNHYNPTYYPYYGR